MVDPLRGAAGPLVVVCGGLHGNEPAGIVAGARVAEEIRSQGVPIAGGLALVAGNLPGLEAGDRYLHRDLNRRWQPDRIAHLASRRPLELCREDHEQLDLVACFEALIADRADPARPVVFLDLHTTSGHTPPFVVSLDDRETLRLAQGTGIPIILDLHRYIDGPILMWWHAHGHRALGIEGGLHDDPAAIRHLEDAIWLLLHAVGVVGHAHLPGRLVLQFGRPPHRLPAISRVVHRHAVVPGSGFAMEPGFRSFDAVREGTLLARDRTGPVRAPADGMVFLPLYQDQGVDGFFVIQAEVA